MNAKLQLISVLAASLTLHGAAMPTEAEVEKAVPKVERMLASEKIALESGKMTRAEVAETAMKLAADADDEAAKLLLMKGAFILHVKDGNLEKAVRTMNVLETAIADMPPQIITNIIETALLGLPDKTANGARLYRLLDATKVAAKSTVADGENLKAVVDGYTWTYRVKNGEAEIVAKKDGKPCCAVSPKLKGHVAIPLTLGGAMVTSIGNEAFRDCKGLVVVTIPPSVTNIGAHAFSDNSELMSFSVDESNPSYSSRNGLLCNKDGTTLISGTSGDVKIPPSVTSIRENAFYGRHGLNTLTIPPTVREIGNEAFESCRELAAVTLPSSVVRVGRGIFADCTGLKQIDVEEGNPNYTSVDGVLYTKDRTELWMWPAGQRRVTIPDHVRVIGQWAFLKFDGLKSLTIPSTVTSIGWGAFQGCDGLTSVTIPSSVGSIDGCAFRMCGGLTSVTMEEGITNIGRSAFNDCSGLKSVTIPPSVTEIGGYAFFRCGELTSVTIPRDVTSIGEWTFYGCGNLLSVTMLGERPSAPNNIFHRCAKLKSIHVPANCKSWAGMKEWQGIPLVFDGADEINDSSPTVHAAVESILKGMIKVPGRDFWLSATELTQEQWEPIMEFNLSEHKGAKLPVECVSRDDCDVFLEKLNQTKEVQESQFVFCLPSKEEWTYAVRGGGEETDCWVKPGVVGNVLDMAWVKENSSNETHVVAMKMPNAFGLYDMAGNVWEWTSECDESGKNYARGGAFGNSFETPVGLQYWHRDQNRSWRGGVDIGLRLAAHKRARPLLGGLRRPGASGGGLLGGSLRARRLQRQQESQKAEQRQATIDGYTWSYRVNNGEAEIVAENSGKFACAVSPTPTGDITIPSTLGGAKVTSIGCEAFNECGEMLSVTIPDSVTSIKGSAFRRCGRLALLSLPQSLRCIGGCAFRDCTNLTSMIIPPRVGDIGGRAFQGCSAMTEVMIPESVTNIARIAFLGCSKLTSVTIPSNVRSIGDWAFKGCIGLTSVKISQGLTTFAPHIFHGCSKLKTVTMPSNVVDIAWCAFYECRGLKTVTISPCVTNIGGWAFGRCGGLKSVAIPEYVTNIGGNAFRECTNLTSVTMCGECPAASTNVFGGCSNLKEIHVPANAKSWAGIKEWQGIPLVFDAAN